MKREMVQVLSQRHTYFITSTKPYIAAAVNGFFSKPGLALPFDLSLSLLRITDGQAVGGRVPFSPSTFIVDCIEIRSVCFQVMFISS